MDVLDAVVWDAIIQLLEDPSLIQAEIDRRLETARQSSPTKRREETLQRELVRLRKGIERLLTAYQEDLLSLDELRSRLPELRKREQTAQAELSSLASQESQKATYLRLAETVSAFFSRLRENAQTLDVAERNKIVRLLVKDILVDDDSIVIRHSIPVEAVPPGEPDRSQKPGVSMQTNQCYLLRSGRHVPPSGHSIGWLAIARGELEAGERIVAGDMVIFESSEASIVATARGDTDAVFVLGSAIPHQHELHLGHYSVHTSSHALARGEARIAELGRQLSETGDRRTRSGSTPVFR